MGSLLIRQKGNPSYSSYTQPGRSNASWTSVASTGRARNGIRSLKGGRLPAGSAYLALCIAVIEACDIGHELAGSYRARLLTFEIFRIGIFIPVLDEQPLRVGAAVPQHDSARAVLALPGLRLRSHYTRGDAPRPALQTLDRRIERGAFRNGPGKQDVAPLQTEIVVKVGSLVFADHVLKTWHECSRIPTTRLSSECLGICRLSIGFRFISVCVQVPSFFFGTAVALAKSSTYKKLISSVGPIETRGREANECCKEFNTKRQSKRDRQPGRSRGADERTLGSPNAAFPRALQHRA